MEETRYGPIGKLTKETLSEAIERLTQQVYRIFTIKFKDGLVFDVIENIIKEKIETDGEFECSQENIGDKLLAVHNVKEQEVLSLLIGPYIREPSLKKFSQKMSTLIYTTGMKEEIISIMFAILLKEMKIRFSDKKSGYVYSGVEGIREEGFIRRKD